MDQSRVEGNVTPNSGNSLCRLPQYVLDDLCSRFIINIPEEERQDLIRLFFQIELAHWFYLDFYCAEDPTLKSCGIKDFSSQIFKHCPTLQSHAKEVDKRLEDWRSYKKSVPTYGAIMLDPEIKYCLLVQGFWTKSSWGFPKGKVNEGELPLACAVREVLEETGFDTSNLINENDFLEHHMHDQLARLYIIPGVPLDTKFQPRTRKEIKSLQWFPVEYLPGNKNDQMPKEHLNMNPNNFFMVIPFIRQLRKWISQYQNRLKTVECAQTDYYMKETHNTFSTFMNILQNAKQRSDDSPSYKDMFVNKHKVGQMYADQFNQPSTKNGDDKDAHDKRGGRKKNKGAKFTGESSDVDKYQKGQHSKEYECSQEGVSGSNKRKNSRTQCDDTYSENYYAYDNGSHDVKHSPFGAGDGHDQHRGRSGSKGRDCRTKATNENRFHKSHPDPNIPASRGYSDGNSHRYSKQGQHYMNSPKDKGKFNPQNVHSPKDGSKQGRHYAQSPKDSNKKQQYQIMGRDGNITGRPRRNLTNEFEQVPEDGEMTDQNSEKYTDPPSDVFIPQTWKNFKFDVSQIMAALPSV